MSMAEQEAGFLWKGQCKYSRVVTSSCQSVRLPTILVPRWVWEGDSPKQWTNRFLNQTSIICKRYKKSGASRVDYTYNRNSSSQVASSHYHKQ